VTTAGSPRPEEVARAVELACRLEAAAPKPGNVSPGRSFGDMRYEDFLVSAEAIAPVLAGAGTRALGATVREAVAATRSRTAVNTNLGIILLMAPIARAALTEPAPLRGGVMRVLSASTVSDAMEAYQAIRQAEPAGLGRVSEQDLSQMPTVTLLEAMRLASDRDDVAAEYASGFRTTFVSVLPALRRARKDGLSWEDAVVEVYLGLLAARPDTLIVRKAGAAAAAEVSRQAAAVVSAGGVRSDPGRRALAAFDASLAEPHNSRNPGTTADLIAAGLLALLLTDSPH
jgi:triphosphoribosyl-dephospho-CoA synthase